MTQINEEQVLKALEWVTDFEKGADVVSLGMISGVIVDGSSVRFAIQVEPGDGAIKEPLRAACEKAVRAVPGVESVSAVLTAHNDAAASAPGAFDEGTLAPNINAPDSVSDSMKEAIVVALRKVYDPEIPVSIYDLGLIYGIDIDAENNVDIEMTLTTVGCPVADTMPGEVEAAVRMTVPQVSDVRVALVWDPPWTMERMSEAARLELGFL